MVSVARRLANFENAGYHMISKYRTGWMIDAGAVRSTTIADMGYQGRGVKCRLMRFR